MIESNTPGRPVGTDKKLTAEKIPRLVEAFSQTYVVRRAALLADETPYHLRKWLSEGEDDANNERDTLNAQLFFQVGKKLSTLLADSLKKLESCPKNWQAIAWKLEKCFSDDFGKDSELYKELLADFQKLLQSMGK